MVVAGVGDTAAAALGAAAALAGAVAAPWLAPAVVLCGGWPTLDCAW